MSTKRGRKPTDAEVMAAAHEPRLEDATPANENVSKAEAVRRALAEGLQKPGEIGDFIRQRFGHDIPNQMVSSYAAQQRARERKASGDYQPRSRGTRAEPAGIPATFGADVKQIKGLIEQAGGAGELKDLANAIAALQQRYGASGFDALIDALSDS